MNWFKTQLFRNAFYEATNMALEDVKKEKEKANKGDTKDKENVEIIRE